MRTTGQRTGTSGQLSELAPPASRSVDSDRQADKPESDSGNNVETPLKEEVSHAVTVTLGLISLPATIGITLFITLEHCVFAPTSPQLL